MCLFDLSAGELTALSILAGFGLARGLNPNQQNSLGNFLMSIGQTLEAIAAQQALLDQNSAAPQTDRLAELQHRLEQLEARMEEA